ncbi:MAG: hypothetical protein DSM106950_42270 [Stigonema ocellatum SAG 48.90 = DSM 106950]|nr:hypothetical protein [Stigonema ocellatum SAG 48.90 = DSM 106950]
MPIASSGERSHELYRGESSDRSPPYSVSEARWMHRTLAAIPPVAVTDP